MMRRLFWLAGIAAVLALLFRRRSRPHFESEGFDIDPADALRQKLDEVRQRSELAAEEAAAPPEDIDARRRDVHDRIRAATEEMRESASD
jgi:hypothetical protein